MWEPSRPVTRRASPYLPIHWQIRLILFIAFNVVEKILHLSKNLKNTLLLPLLGFLLEHGIAEDIV
jgi:hypothetical protein